MLGLTQRRPSPVPVLTADGLCVLVTTYIQQPQDRPPEPPADCPQPSVPPMGERDGPGQSHCRQCCRPCCPLGAAVGAARLCPAGNTRRGLGPLGGIACIRHRRGLSGSPRACLHWVTKESSWQGQVAASWFTLGAPAGSSVPRDPPPAPSRNSKVAVGWAAQIRAAGKAAQVVASRWRSRGARR